MRYLRVPCAPAVLRRCLPQTLGRRDTLKMNTQTRTAETLQALRTLKEHLNALPNSDNPRAVIDGLAEAARKANPKWTVPPLGHLDGMKKIYPDGTVRVMLLAHQLFINSNGAYRIIDLHPPHGVFHERPSSTGASFVAPMAGSNSAAA